MSLIRPALAYAFLRVSAKIPVGVVVVVELSEALWG